MERTRYDDGTWEVEYSAGDRSFTFEVTEYHAGPLRMTLDQLSRLAGGAGPVEGEDPEPKPSAEAAAPAAPFGAEPLVGISRKEKSLYIAVPAGWSGVLRIPRKELYRCGKKMGRRGKGRKDPSLGASV